MEFGDPFADCEAESRSTRTLGDTALAAVKPIKEGWKFIGRDSAAGILHANLHPIIVEPG